MNGLIFYMEYIGYILLPFCLLANYSLGQGTQNSPHKNSGFIDLNAYHDNRNFSVMTVNALVNLPKNFSYFSLTNFQSLGIEPGYMSFFTEQNIRWKVKKNAPMDVTGQWVMNSGGAASKFRMGIRIRLNNHRSAAHIVDKIKLSYSINFHLLEMNMQRELKFSPQIEHVYRIDIFPAQLDNRIYIGGFADQNIVSISDEEFQFKWVSEHQLGLRTVDQFYLVAEYRINNFLLSGNTGLGYGLEYKITF